MSGLSRFLGVALLVASLSGCVTYPYSYYAPGDPYASGSGYYAGESFDDGYGGGYDDGYGGNYAEPLAQGYATGWPVYYSTLWPVYRNYYDPFWSPGFYYGVTWFPSTYFGLGIGGWDAWPYYTHYSPYRYAFWDSYYAWHDPWWYGGGYGHGHWRGHGDWDDDDDWRGGRGGRDPSNGGGGPRFGSARNEAERLARIDGLSGPGAQSRRYGDYDSAQGATGRNWRGTPPQGALSQAGAAGRAPLSNAGLYEGGRFAGRPGATPAGAVQPPVKENATAGYTPGATAGRSRGEIQRMGGAPGYPAPDRPNAYNAPAARTPAPADRNSGWVGPATRSRPTGRYDERQYDPSTTTGSGQPSRSGYTRQVPQGDYAPIQGSTGGSSRWRSAPQNSPTAPGAESWNRPGNAQRGNAPSNGGYPARGRQSVPQGDYSAPQAESSARFDSRPQRYEAPQRNYEAPQQSYQAPQRREAPAPRYEAPQRQESRDDNDNDDNGGGGRGDSSRFERGGRDRED